MPRPARSVPPDELARLALIRTSAEPERAAFDQAVAERAELVASRGPDLAEDPLGAVAWCWAALGGDSTVTGQAIETAQEHARRSWKEIAAACGIDPEDAHAVEAFALARRRRRG